MNLLIIGGTGVLSSAVTTEAINKGISVTMINRGRRSLPDKVELIKADKDDFVTIESKLQERSFDAVIDFLCLTQEQTRKSVAFYQKYTKQYIFISSCAVYNTLALNGQIGDEDSPKVLSVWDYSVEKWACEEHLKKVFEEGNTHYTIIRPCVTYDNTRIPYGITPPYGFHWTLCARILEGKPIIIWNGGLNRCNITRVEDFAVGVVELIGNPNAYNEAFNICGDEAPTWNEVLVCLGDILGKDVNTVDISSDFYAKELPEFAGEILGGRSIDSINSSDKIKGIVPSFKQTIFLKEGLTRTIESYKANNYHKGIDWEFDANTDRIINKWCKINNLPMIKLGFVDYFNNATFSNRFNYWITFHRDIFIVRGLITFSNLINIIIRKGKRIIKR